MGSLGARGFLGSGVKECEKIDGPWVMECEKIVGPRGHGVREDSWPQGSWNARRWLVLE